MGIRIRSRIIPAGLTTDRYPLSWPGLTRQSPEAEIMRRAADHADASGDGRVKPYRVHTSREYSGLRTKQMSCQRVDFPAPNPGWNFSVLETRDFLDHSADLGTR